MTITEIRKIEEERKDQLDVVHLIKEGSFYHANDWSAWLMTKYTSLSRIYFKSFIKKNGEKDIGI